MPSDAKKKEQERKKAAAKARQSGKKPTVQQKGNDNGKENSNSSTSVTQNGTNGTVPLSAEGKFIRCILFLESPSSFLFISIKVWADFFLFFLIFCEQN